MKNCDSFAVMYLYVSFAPPDGRLEYVAIIFLLVDIILFFLRYFA